MTARKEVDAHMDAGLVAAYVDGRATVADASKIEAHLAECADCRREMIEVRRLLVPHGRRWAWATIAVLGAAAVMLLVLGRPSGQRDADPNTTRGGLPDVPPATALLPVDGATVPAAELRFTWKSVGNAVAYRITLADESGDALWTTESADTSLAPPPAVRLIADRTYYWSVDVLLPDGRSTTTGFHEFRIAR